jgi:cell division protein FtsL
MTQIAIAPRVGAVRNPYASIKAGVTTSEGSRTVSIIGKNGADRMPVRQMIAAEPPVATKPAGETLEKVVRRIPTLYVIAFFGVVVGCAVLIIWNTLQVNRLTLERTRLSDRIAQTEQRLIKLRAHEMQLSAPSRIREIAKAKLGMVETTGEDVIILP